MEYAIKDANTAVLILSDHGNSGFTIGTNNCPGYDKLSMEDLFETVSGIKLSANGLESILINTEPENFRSEFREYTGIDITDEELEMLQSSKNYRETDYTKKGTSRDRKSTRLNSSHVRI